MVVPSCISYISFYFILILAKLHIVILPIFLKNELILVVHQPWFTYLKKLRYCV